jgi:2-polyprenyl-3-methyl-5-hydroxy-6-metoxy-1,4-benzoquinol methylase
LYREEYTLSDAIKTNRAKHEIMHGKNLADADPELIWGWKNPAGQRRAERRAGLIAASAFLSRGKYSLEIGCGTGVFTEMFAQTGAKIIAVDISGDLLELARAKAMPSDQVSFLECRFEDCTQQGPFDAIIGSSVLHHLDIEPALATIYSLLKPNGLMSFAEPNMLNPQIALQKNIPWIKKRMGDSPDETAFTKRQMRKLLSDAGFIDTQVTPFDWLHPATPSMLISFVERAGYIIEQMPLLREFAGSLLIRARRPAE